ncbi:Arc family DNA-binding protein [Xenorhabdus bovienii]|uniref:Arc family DNA-binding protein n=1 Tax=Xenorhabdus bovienii TaxID=40576 RepID=UPI00237C85C1|nr:Arc family DNA-binding protein [Xenorhabdus bovienii]MDE1492805.1 Arc family DNA-binding protein [Xenorhabdus bovienii]MDE9442364.1 Arc family DNA-binding protein [Xenorhabdus bovienii]MDE9549427.1 Arc family DNA-binding protein [Xenorhabdus bovienii]MDE9557833.1 Arc family DNA-binding protein [Xenorhabdus bovienii]
MTKKYPSQEMDRFNVRMPAGMRDEITKIAEKNGRSMNTEIIMMLQEAIDSARNADSSHQNVQLVNGSDTASTISINIDKEKYNAAINKAVTLLIAEELLNDDGNEDNDEFKEFFMKIAENVNKKLNK